jgi:hypothetical protein
MLDMWHEMIFGPGALTWQSQRVVTLRLNKFACEGFAASSEARQMVDEKLSAFSSAAIKLATGTFPHVVLRDFRSVVDENVARLSK